MHKPRLHDLGVVVGRMPTGPMNALTDVPGVAVGHVTIVEDAPRVVRTGVTVILPTDRHPWETGVFAGVHVLNGFGEMTGALWIEEAGVLASPIAITSTFSVGAVHEGLQAHAAAHAEPTLITLPVVAETYDGWLSDGAAFAVRPHHVAEAIRSASTGPVPEGCVGGGTGMICHGFKGGVGTASRVAATAAAGTYTVGALVQANYGDRADLTVAGRPVGAAIGGDVVPVPARPGPAPGTDGSIIIVLATDAPLLPVQCRRLAQRATVGLARVGGYGHDSSGDIFLAFSTAQPIDLARRDRVAGLAMLPNQTLDPLFHAAAEAVEEAILNALVAAETMTGKLGRTVHALPHDRLVAAMRG